MSKICKCPKPQDIRSDWDSSLQRVIDDYVNLREITAQNAYHAERLKEADKIMRDNEQLIFELDFCFLDEKMKSKFKNWAQVSITVKRDTHNLISETWLWQVLWDLRKSEFILFELNRKELEKINSVMRCLEK